MPISAIVVPWYLIARTKDGKISAKLRSISGFSPSQFAEATQGVESLGAWIIITGEFASALSTLLLLVNTSFIIVGKKFLRRYFLTKRRPPRSTRSFGTS